MLRIATAVALVAVLAGGCDRGDPDPAVVETGSLGAAPPAADTTPEAVDGTAGQPGILRLGYALPRTGDWELLGPAMIAGVELATSEINALRPLLGFQIELIAADEGATATSAREAIDELLASDVHAIVGPAESRRSLAVIDRIARAGVVQCSPANTSPAFTGYNHRGYYIRTAPSDALQGQALAQLAARAGAGRVALLARNDDSGGALAEAAADSLAGVETGVLDVVLYDLDSDALDAAIARVAQFDPEAVILGAEEEGVGILQSLVSAGFGPQDIRVYATAPLARRDLNALVDPADPNIIDGLRGTVPLFTPQPDFADRLQQFEPGVRDTRYGAEAHDCVTIMALAAITAGSQDPAAFVDELIRVTRDGRECATFPECVELIEAGVDINYVGAGGRLRLTDDGEPAQGSYEVWEWQDGAFATVAEITSAP